jgi:hypothetical protein
MFKLNFVQVCICLLTLTFAGFAFSLTDLFLEATNDLKAGRFDIAAQKFLIGAKQGDSASQSVMGALYKAGQGVPENKREAFNWHKKAALQGNTISQYEIAVAYFGGIGAKEDKFKSYMWANIAVAGLNETFDASTKELFNLVKTTSRLRLTPKQIEEANELSFQCVNTNFKVCD